MKPAVTIDQARANVDAVVQHALTDTLSSRLSADDREAVQRRKTSVEVSQGSRGFSRLRADFSTPLLLLMALVGLVLLVACVNVANLLLARSTARQREMAVRFAMGAGPGRIVRQLLTESVLLAFFGAMFGLLLANWGSSVLVGLANASRSSSSPLSLGVDWRVLGFTAGICLLAGVVFGLAPALRFLDASLGLALKEGQRESGRGPKSTMGRILLSSQITLGVLVLMTAGLLVRSLRNMQEADLGYSREQLVLARVDLLASGYKSAAIQGATQELLLRFAALPGVRGVTASSNGLFSGTESADIIHVDGVASPNRDDDNTNDDQVGPNYFSTIGVPIVSGRDISQQDFSSSAHVTVVNETFAKFYFGERNPLGHKIYMQDSEHPNQPPYEIVGVASDVHDHGVREAVPRRMYAPLNGPTFDQEGAPNFEIRAVGNSEAVVNSVRDTIRGLNPNLIVESVKTADGLVSDTLTSQIMVAKLSAFFGALVLVLVCVGLYGSLAYNVAARTKEIGIRMALGAPHADVIWSVTREVWIVLAIGVGAGIPIGVSAAYLFKAMLFGVSKADPLSISLSIVALIGICVAAAVIPARRATCVDPLVALRYE
jgi:predicted permease